MSAASQLPGPAGLPAAEALHAAFCRARESSKRLRFIAFLAELAVVGITGWRILGRPPMAELPLVILAFTIVEVVTRHFVDRIRMYAQRCRRVSLRAYASGIDPAATLSATLHADLPSLVTVLTPRFTWPALKAYYNFEQLSGDARLRAISAYSAFFSSRLLSRWTVLLVLSLLLVAAGGVTVLYYLAISTTAAHEARSVYVDALLTVAWWYAVIRIFEAVMESWHLAGRYSRIFDLLNQAQPAGNDLGTIVDEYDYFRVRGFEAPTLLYRVSDKGLEKKWAVVRQAFLT